MFKVSYFKSAMVINTINLRRISFQNIENLRRLIIQLMANPCGKIIFNLKGINFVDSISFSVIEGLHKLALRQDVIFEFVNLSKDARELFNLIPYSKNYKIVDNAEIAVEMEESELV